MTNTFVHPFSHLATAPYRFSRYKEITHKVPGQNSQAGGTCDHCGTGIRHGFFFKGAEGVEFVVGSACAELAFAKNKEELKAVRKAMRDARSAVENAIALAEREAKERANNGGFTNKELRDLRVAEEKALEAAKKAAEAEKAAASVFVGAVGEKASLTLTKKFSTSFPDGFGGLKYLTAFEDSEGNAICYIGNPLPIREGETVQLGATIKGHSVYAPSGKAPYNQTMLARPQTKKMVIVSSDVADRVGTNGSP